jgi:flagellar assembly factor FliW
VTGVVAAVPSQAGPGRSTTVEDVPQELPEIRFVRPIPGFPDLSRYVLVRLGDEAGGESDDDADGVVFELRSVEQPEVRFLVGVPDAFFAEYAVELDDLTCEELSLESADDALVLVVLTISDNGASTTANLLAPVVLNARLRVAAQVILSGTDWPVRAVVA